jgi:hypothetical protein
VAVKPTSARAARRARRAEQRRVQPPPRRAAAPAAVGRRLALVSWWAWALLTAAFLVLTAAGIGRRITWYLAVDQFGYLTFANDLLHGRIFHDWPPIQALARRVPAHVDVLVQTYIWDHGRMYSRYAPGFPVLLAGWMALFGRDGAHYLNPTIFIALLALVTAFGARVFRSVWRGTAAMALAVLCPTMVHLWGLTPTRDLACHLFGILGLFLLLPARGQPLRARRVAVAALALGFASSTRPDAILYVASGVAVAALRWWRERAPWGVVARALGAGALGLLVGLAPLLIFNWMTTGNPLLPTQGVELKNFFRQPATAPRVGYPPGAWRGGIMEEVQGGGLSLRNVPTTLPDILAMLRNAYGEALLGATLLGAVLAAVRRRLLFAAVVPYTVLAILLFSCWTRADSRYQAGLHMLLPLLMVEGLCGPLDLVRRLALRRQVSAARIVALGAATLIVVAAALTNGAALPGALKVLVIVLPVIAGGAAIAAAVWPLRRVAGLAAPAIALFLLCYGGWRAWAGLSARASFQRPQMVLAQATFSQAVKPPAVVITTEDIGRPAENIEWYSGVAHALYFTDLMRWHITVAQAAPLLARGGFTPYLLIPTTQPDRVKLLEDLQRVMTVELVVDIPARQAIEYFVAAPFHRGIHLELYRLSLPS